ncbi:hypothetical protein [Bradyrhizobium sp. RT9a]|uniref:hypothetical protein n=1 Tax=Bradyrhizobium sp. RT9a TaxID=3156384 RepID=UPI00339AF204
MQITETTRLWTMPQLKALGGLHPNPAGIKAVVTRILPLVEVLIERARLQRPLTFSIHGR